MTLTTRSPPRAAAKKSTSAAENKPPKDNPAETNRKNRSDSLSKRKRSTSLESKGKRNKQVICSICDKDFIDNRDSVECECCARWFHYPCASLTKREFDAISLLKGKSHWYCSQCNAGASLLYQDTARLRHRQDQIQKDIRKIKTDQENAKNEQEKTKKEVEEVGKRVTTAESDLVKLKEEAKAEKQSVESAKLKATNAETISKENSESLKTVKINQEKNLEDIVKVNTKINEMEEKLLKKVSEVVTQLIDEKVIDPKVDDKVAKSVSEKFASIINENDDINVKQIVNTCVEEEFKEKFKSLTDDKGEINVPQVVLSCVDDRLKTIKDKEFPTLVNPDGALDEVFTNPTSSKEVLAIVVEQQEIQKRKRDLMISNLKEAANAESDKKTSLRPLCSHGT